MFPFLDATNQLPLKKGGGLAIITGSQSKTNAVAISGPNAKLSRDSFYPPLSVDDLNTYTFNVIPNRDPIPMIDDVARLYQNIDCVSRGLSCCYLFTLNEINLAHPFLYRLLQRMTSLDATTLPAPSVRYNLRADQMIVQYFVNVLWITAIQSQRQMMREHQHHS